ncbi:MAG: hypothetical protein AB7T31_00900 [Gemmatimonadales bacterium]
MRADAIAAAVMLGALACAPPSTYSTGTGGPVPWTPGRYVLEATVGTGSLSDQDFRAVLTIAPDGDMTLDSSTGLCRDPTLSQLHQDEASAQRSFECGDAYYRVQPTPGGVRGDIRATIQEEYEAQVPCPSNVTRPVCTIMRTRTVVRSERLRVSTLD